MLRTGAEPFVVVLKLLSWEWSEGAASGGFLKDSPDLKDLDWMPKPCLDAREGRCQQYVKV